MLQGSQCREPRRLQCERHLQVHAPVGRAPLTIGVWDVESGKLLGWRNITAKSLAAFPVLSADRKTLYILRTSGRLMRWNYATNTTEHWDIGPNSEWDLGLNSHALAVSGSTAYVATSSDHTVTLTRIAILSSD